MTHVKAAKRTPFGAFGGKLKNFSPTELCLFASKACLNGKYNNIKPTDIDSTVVGHVIHTSPSSIYLARHVGLKLGLDVSSPALTVNRLCGSGFQSIINGYQEIATHNSEVVLCGGTENMSLSPYMLRDARFGIKLGTDLKLEDSLWQGLTDTYVNMPMSITAENLAQKYGITKLEADTYALQSQMRWKNAQKENAFDDEICPINIATKKDPNKVLSIDEHPKPETTLDTLTKLPALFKKDGTVSAGNASGISDGAGAVILADGKTCKRKGFKPLARIVSYHVTGCDPAIMGIGPVEAIRHALKKADLPLKKMDLIEVNEAFASQYLAVERELDLDPSRTNVCGGAIAIGHPLAASGSRIIAHLTHQLIRKNLTYAVGSACIGGGQGIAIVIENAIKNSNF